VAPGIPRSLLLSQPARVLAAIVVLGFLATRSAADMYHKDDQTAQAPVDNGPSLSDKTSDSFEKLQPLIDAKQWDAAVSLLDSMAAAVDASTYQGGYDTAMILDTKAKILVEADRMGEAIAPWEAVLALCQKHPSYFYLKQIADIIHYLSQIYSQQASAVKLTPGPDLAERQALQRDYFEKSVGYMKRWLKDNPKATQDDELYYADMLFNLSSTTTGDAAAQLLTEAEQAAQRGLHMALHPRDDLYYLEAVAAEQKGDLPKAADYLELLVTHKPDSKVYLPQLMTIYLTLAEGSKDKEKTRDYYMRAINSIERAQAHGLMNDQKTNLNLVTIYFDMGQFGQATELLSAGLKNGSIEPAERNWEVLAYSYQQVNENVQAINAYKDAEALYPENGQIDYSIGQIYSQMDDLANAYQYYVAAARKGHVTNAYAVYELIAFSAYELQKFKEALQACDDAAKLPDAEKDTQLPQLRTAIEDKIKEQERSKAPEAS
jgi:tetratricopeptide (TPR) repeat protein